MSLDNEYQIFRLCEVMKRTGLSRSTIYDWIRQGTFPHSVNLGCRTVGWLKSDIDTWIKSRTPTNRTN